MKTTIYEYLLEKQENGELEILFSIGLNRAKILQMMKIYAYHLSHPNASSNIKDFLMENIVETLQKCRITPSADIQPHEFLYSWNNKPMLARGELIAIGGKAKSGKTYVCSIFICMHTPDLVIFDGIRDVVGDINDYQQGRARTRLPLLWGKTY